MAPRVALDEVARNKIMAVIVNKEREFLPQPNVEFRQTISSVTNAVTAKVTEMDPRVIRNPTVGLSDLHKARYIKIREDLERSHQAFPAQKYSCTVLSSHETGFDVNKRTKQQIRSARKHSKPRISSNITKFADQYYRIQGASPFGKNTK
mmetsp:Transcript_21110/g.44005  ORF Transcript_21110/g.44005 Transcript_21110/m.44005 type:complete len:150 (-) Transcript_21110:7-456(-)